MKLANLETKTQEVIFLLTVVGAVTVISGGLFYLLIDPNNLPPIAGVWGSEFLKSIFSLMGYSMFSIAISIFVTGRFLILRVTESKDLLRQHRLLGLQVFVGIWLITLIASLLSVLEAYIGFRASGILEYGAGGVIGTIVGGTLYQGIGLFGALTFLLSILIVTGISTGYIQLVNVSLFVSDQIKESSKLGIETLKTKSHSLWETLGVGFSMVTNGSFQLNPISSEGQIVTPPPVFTEEELRVIDDHQDLEFIPLQLGEELDEGFREKEVETVSEKASKPKTAEVIKTAATASEKPKRTRKTKTEVKKQVVTEVNDEEMEQDSSNGDIKEANIEIKKWTGRYTKPETSLLAKPKKVAPMSKSEIDKQCRELEERLESFQIKGKVMSAHQGATLTMYEFQPAPGVKVSKISSLTDDLALLLGASSIRVLTPIPGKTTVGIEVPNKNPRPIGFLDLVKNVQKSAKEMDLPIALGQNVNNEVVVEDIATMPHMLVSGTTGSGKSVFINTLITSLLYTKSPKELRFLMIDPKMIELNSYNGIPHLLKPVVTDVEEAKDLLVWAEQEMDRRYERFSDIQSRNITTFNEAIKKGSKESAERRSKKKLDWAWEEMPYIVIVIDELADLMITQGKLVEVPITRIAQKARAAGIHLVMATQRPSAEIVTGLIKTNFPTRMAFKVSSSIDSRTILDTSGAEKLLGKGDMLFMPNGKSLERIQGCFISEGEVKKIVKSIT